jgi:uncharacterized protein (UPF0303 family)
MPSSISIRFAERKRQAVLVRRHSSAWGLVHAAVNSVDPEQLFSDPDVLYAAGSFPIFVNGTLSYTLSVSGLHHGEDYLLMLDAFTKYLNTPMPAVSCILI